MNRVLKAATDRPRMSLKLESDTESYDASQQ